jgi:hypothetical protein
MVDTSISFDLVYGVYKVLAKLVELKILDKDSALWKSEI